MRSMHRAQVDTHLPQQLFVVWYSTRLQQSDRTDLVPGSQGFNFNGAAVTGADGRLRYPFVTTVSVRNRSQ